MFNGTTLHHALKLPLEDGHGAVARSTYKPLEGSVLEDQMAIWKDVRYLIIDEISMVSIRQLANISTRLQESKGVHDLPFGGVSILAVGDFYQLPPVKAPWVFIGEGSETLWHKYFKSESHSTN